MPSLVVHDLGGEGPTLAMVHGFTGSSDDFAEVAPSLRDVRRVVLIDQLGHGESPRIEQYDYPTLTASVAGAIARFDPPVDLLGHSLGGRVVLPIAIEHPELVRSLVMMDTWGDRPDRDPAGASFADDLAAGHSVADALDRYDAARPDPESELIIAQRGEEWHRARLAHNEALVDPAALEQLAPLVLLDDSSTLDHAGRINAPVTVLVGEHDLPFLGPSNRLAARIPGAHLVVIEGAFHSPQLTHPGEWLHAIRRHLGAH